MANRSGVWGPGVFALFGLLVSTGTLTRRHPALRFDGADRILLRPSQHNPPDPCCVPVNTIRETRQHSHTTPSPPVNDFADFTWWERPVLADSQGPRRAPAALLSQAQSTHSPNTAMNKLSA
jgi:hypothetical protein